MTPYAEEWAPKARELWLAEHPTGRKVYEDEMSQQSVDFKAKVIAEEDAHEEAVIE